MKLSAELVTTVKDANPIERLVSEYVALRRSGHQLVGRCPFHDDHSPSFYVHPEKQKFYCHGCGLGGDVFTFIQMLKGCSFPLAVQFLAATAGLSVEGFQPTPELSQKVKALKKEREAEAAFTRFYNSRLDEIYRVNRALAHAANYAEKALQVGGLDPDIENLHWDALKWYRHYEARIEREGIAHRDALRAEWEREHAVAA